MNFNRLLKLFNYFLVLCIKIILFLGILSGSYWPVVIVLGWVIFYEDYSLHKELLMRKFRRPNQSVSIRK